MGIHNLFRICLAVFSVPTIAFANDVRVGVSPTTGYYEVTSKTFNVPKGATVSPSTAVSPVVTPLSGGGFQQSMGGGITIEGLKKPAPFTARAAAGLQTMKNGAKKLARSNPARFAAATGLAVLMDSVDWVIDQGKISSVPLDFNAPFPMGKPDPSVVAYSYRVERYFRNTDQGAPPPPAGVNIVQTRYVPDSGLGNKTGGIDYWYCPGFNPPMYFLTYYGGMCYSTRLEDQAYIPKPPPVSPVPDETIDSVIDSNYSPVSDDFVLLTPYMSPDFLLVDPIPPVLTDLGITNTFDSTGSLVGTEQKTSTTDFTISNNSTSQPSISSSTSVKTETFKDGQSQGSTVTDTSSPAVGSGSVPPDIEIPTDCDFMPTVCAFLDWFKNDDTPDDPDLSALIDNRDFTETYSITGGSKQCPADYEFTVDFIGRTYGLSFEPACDFASKMYYFVMAAAYIFAAYITIGASRNG